MFTRKKLAVLTVAALLATGYLPAAQALPDASGITSSIGGTLESRSVTVDLKFDSADYGKEIGIYIAMIAGKSVFFINESNAFVPFDGKNVPRNAVYKPSSAKATFTIARNINVMQLPGLALVVGYGTSATEMLAAKRYRQVYPSEVVDGQPITLPVPRTPQAMADAQDMLDNLKNRLSRYNPNDPAIAQDANFLRDAWLVDQIGKQLAEQMQKEQKILEDAAKTGTLSLPPGTSVSIPTDGGSTRPSGCGKTLECKTNYDPEGGGYVLTVSSADVPSSTGSSTGSTTSGTSAPGPSGTTPTTITADEMPLEGAPTLVLPGSISLQACMPWSSSCANKTSFNYADLGTGYDTLASAVSSQASGMLNQCYQYILNVYNAQCPNGGSCHGSNDRAVVTGSYSSVTKNYELECHEAANFWTYTKGAKIYVASINAAGVVTAPRANYAMRLYKSFADTKKASMQKLVTNVLVGQVPYLNVANSLVKCVSGQTAVDWAYNAFAEINTLGCIETAANVVKSLAAVPSLALRTQEARFLYQNMSLAARGIADEAKYVGWGATGMGMAEEFYRRGKYAIRNADLRQ